ncbi:hypothetical protein B0H16DRAFT_1883176 [Mycena metata]|uniref:Transcription factor domain-containing protein n=1 Tax=Mycena metata TaxID=1033252 RepID=A0AAD7JKC2_9AGAR|nr:hypothetical protein B0H16DRAFT_1883176 [Mycena metata]
MDMAEKLIDIFLPFSSEVGFFLNTSRFRHSALIRHPIGHPSRPSPAVLAAVYLWGLRLSKQPFLTTQEPIFLFRALERLAKGLSGIHPQKAMHNLQAEILLSYYFFASGRFLEGRYHTAAAISLGLGSSIHMVRSAHSTSLSLLRPARDAVEEGERIHACWIAMILDKIWAVALSDAPNLDHQHESCAVDTPWPLEMNAYEEGRFSPTARYSNTFHNFVNCVPTSDTGMSTIALLSKATILWQRADSLARQWRPDMPWDQFTSFHTSFLALDSLIDTFRAGLVPLNCIAHLTPAMARILVVAHSIAYAATIRLHSVIPLAMDVNARCKRLTAARAVLEIVVAIPLHHFGFINPIMGTVWLSASQVLVDELHLLRRQHVPRQGEVEAHTMLFTRALEVLLTFSDSCPLLGYRISRIQEICVGMP